MAAIVRNTVLMDTFGPTEGTALRAKQALMVVLGIALLAASAKVQVFLPGNPVPITMSTFGVLTIGAAYGARLGLITVLGYLALGALGASVFAGRRPG